MPVLWFYVCIQLLVHAARGQRGTGSQTGFLLCAGRHNSFGNVTGGFSVVLEFHRVRGAAL